MRSTKLAALLSFPGWAAFSLSCFAIEVASSSVPDVAVSAVAVSGTDIKTPVVTPAANFQVAEVESVSPSDRMSTPAKPIPNTSSMPAPPTESTLGKYSISPYQLPYAPGPSGPSYLLKYMNCDPHSCPNLWQGYEAQRAAELAAKCAPPGGGCGCGRQGCGGCSGLQLYPSPCVGGAAGCAKPLNRYRQAAPACSVGCDACSLPESNGAPCASCQAAKVAPAPVSTAALPTEARR